MSMHKVPKKSRQQNLFPLNLKEKSFIQAISYLEFGDQMAKSVDPDEVALYEPPHLALCFLQIFGFLRDVTCLQHPAHARYY